MPSAKGLDFPSVLASMSVLALIVAVTLTAGSAVVALTVGGSLIAGFLFGGIVIWRFVHHLLFLGVGAALIVFGLLFFFTILYGELWALAGLVVFGMGLGVATRRWMVAQGG